MESIAIIILAAGKGTRMGQELPKVLTKTSEMTLIEHVLGLAASLNPEKTVVVTGYESERVKASVLDNEPLSRAANVEFSIQEQQNGTGDAVKAALPALKDFKGTVLILYGDVPLIQKATIKDLVAQHEEQKSTVTLLTLKGDVSNAYGRVIRNGQGAIEKITEVKDCSTSEKYIDETNSGIYAVDSAFLHPAIEGLDNNNAQGEYYLTDIVEKAASEGQTVAAIPTFCAAEIQGINTRADLIAVNNELRMRRNADLAISGVLILDPQSTYIESSVKIEAGVEIGPNTTLKGQTSIGAGSKIEGSAYLIDTKVGENVSIKFNVRAESAIIEKGASLGPFAQLRNGAVLGEDVKVGNFVEVKNSKLEKGVKAGHLAYLGDAEIKENVNIGAGVITANYDGKNKFKTIVEKDSFIGSNSVLIAPVEIGESAFVGAGSVISKNVPDKALAFTRAALKQKENWKK